MDRNNTGDYNAGCCNTGAGNTGDYNAGYCNAGDYNTGDRNTGDWNTGDWNAGDYNTGDCNTGDCNTGNNNTGDDNIGDCNTGNCNAGHYNTGDYNIGCCNICNNSSGVFCITEPTINLFDKPTNMTLTQFKKTKAYDILRRYLHLFKWINGNDMSKEEKELHPEHGTAGGYYKELSYEEMWKNAWLEMTNEEKQEIMNLPNFDKYIFYKITSIKLK